MIIRRLGPLSLGKMLGGLYFIMGLIFGLIISIMSMVIPAMSHSGTAQGGGLVGIMFGAFAVIALPIFYGAMGFVGGLLSAVLYNVIARFMGGIEIEFEPPISALPKEPIPSSNDNV